MTRRARVWGAALAGATGLLAAPGCGTGEDAAAGDLPSEITCDAFYRPDTESGAGREEATLDRLPWSVPSPWRAEGRPRSVISARTA
ncbi:hypothetical protein DFP74_0159 [Nocardiopsis sp. Huas11]|uniref:hypothetical protein n=1 Tax=Nocardiopsis sp. Huas11 TaxID=2183912 RepID=UPI000F0E67DB|nr:hypothetical protein [Nocardiopsis sp. Huas11]RKS04599.1 hypothetical protein DFP74_0159 [Nocardiopsis sp. Huas11]